VRAVAAAVIAVVVALIAWPGAASGQSYRIPPDNPFVGVPGARGEIYALGMRNPYRWSFDRQTGDMIVGDVGGTQEEITLVPSGAIAGADLGWNCWSGTAPGPGNCDPANDIPPSHTFPSAGPDSGVVIGGYVVRAPNMPTRQGQYIYGDFANGDLYWLGPGASGPRQNANADVPMVSGFGEDGLGHLYATSLNGPVVRLGQDGSGALTTGSIGTFSQPVGVAAPPGDPERLFIVEKPGVVKLRTGASVSDFLDITGLVGDAGFEEGLLAFAPAPDYATSGRVYAFYTDNNSDLQLDEYVRTATDPDRSDLGTRRPLLTIPHQPADNHNGGQLLFGQDGYLYLSTGDGGVQGDPEGDARNLGSLLGKILRIDVNTVAGPSSQPQVVADTTPPTLRVRAKRRQRVLRLRGVVAYVRCSESCSVAARGRLRIGQARYRMRPLARAAQANRRVRLKVRLTQRGRRALRRCARRGRLRRASVRLDLRATDSAGLRSPVVRRTVRVRR
jgi:Glucose / Sorbosone dehydrogenase